MFPSSILRMYPGSYRQPALPREIKSELLHPFSVQCPWGAPCRPCILSETSKHGFLGQRISPWVRRSRRDEALAANLALYSWAVLLCGDLDVRAVPRLS